MGGCEFQSLKLVCPWSSLVVGDEGCTAQGESCFVYVKTKKIMQQMHGLVP